MCWSLREVGGMNWFLNRIELKMRFLLNQIGLRSIQLIIMISKPIDNNAYIYTFINN